MGSLIGAVVSNQSNFEAPAHLTPSPFRFVALMLQIYLVAHTQNHESNLSPVS